MVGTLLSTSLAGGADLKAIQAMLGHTSIILTAGTYTSVLPDLARATVEAVAAQILTAARTPRPHRGPTLASRACGMTGRRGA